MWPLPSHGKKFLRRACEKKRKEIGPVLKRTSMCPLLALAVNTTEVIVVGTY